MIADMEANRKLSPIVPGYYLRSRKLNMSFIFISQSYFKVHKTIRLNATHYLIIKIPKQEHQIVSNHSSDIEFKNFM